MDNPRESISLHIWQMIAACIITFTFVTASGCDGILSWKGKGFTVQWDGQAHVLKLGDR
jgi:hypothetical protein